MLARSTVCTPIVYLPTTDLYDRLVKVISSGVVFLGCSCWLGVGGVDTSAGMPWGSPEATGVPEGPQGSSKGKPDSSTASGTGRLTATEREFYSI